jgi:hypothetical protein
MERYSLNHYHDTTPRFCLTSGFLCHEKVTRILQVQLYVDKRFLTFALFISHSKKKRKDTRNKTKIKENKALTLPTKKR